MAPYCLVPVGYTVAAAGSCPAARVRPRPYSFRRPMTKPRITPPIVSDAPPLRRARLRLLPRGVFIWVIERTSAEGGLEARLCPVGPDRTAEEGCDEVLRELAARHGAPQRWPEGLAVEVRGSRLTPRLRVLCERWGLTALQTARDGFRAARPNPP